MPNTYQLWGRELLMDECRLTTRCWVFSLVFLELEAAKSTADTKRHEQLHRSINDLKIR